MNASVLSALAVVLASGVAQAGETISDKPLDEAFVFEATAAAAPLAEEKKAEAIESFELAAAVEEIAKPVLEVISTINFGDDKAALDIPLPAEMPGIGEKLKG